MNKKTLYIIGIIICVLVLIIAVNTSGNIAPIVGIPSLCGIIYFANKIDKFNKSLDSLNNNENSVNYSFDYSNWGFSQSEFNDMKQQIIENWNKNKKTKKKVIPFDNDVYWGLIQQHKIFSKTQEEFQYYQELEKEFLRVEELDKKNKSLSKKNNISKDDDSLDLSNFSQEYLNAKLDDGLAPKKHMKEGYAKVINSSIPIVSQNIKNINTRKLNIISNRIYDKTITKYYDLIVSNMVSRSEPKDINKLEEIFIKEFLYQVQFVRKKYSISLVRYSDGSLMIEYNFAPVGKINLRNENNIYMQIYLGLTKSKVLYDLSFDEALQNICYWISYVKNHLKNQHF